MSSLSPVKIWVAQLKDGDPQAAEQLWNTYFLRMVKAARAKLHSSPSRMADEEDVALSAFKSFCRGTQDGRFPQLHLHEDPWPLLLALTTHKAIDLVRYERRVKRGGSRVHASNPSGLQTQPEVEAMFAELIGREPDPQVTLQLAEECQHLLDRISDTVLRAIGSGKWKGSRPRKSPPN